ncbi:hypothetical protein OTU49_000988, partial [Cherax quadricarinatus]
VLVVNDSHMCEEAGETSARKNLANSRKILQCPQCTFIAITRSHFIEHCRTHNGEKPYTCPECSYQTGDPSHLKRHIRIHTGEKPYSCPHCPYRSSENAKVKRHLLTHKCGWLMRVKWLMKKESQVLRSLSSAPERWQNCISSLTMHIEMRTLLAM